MLAQHSQYYDNAMLWPCYKFYFFAVVYTMYWSGMFISLYFPDKLVWG